MSGQTPLQYPKEIAPDQLDFSFDLPMWAYNPLGSLPPIDKTSAAWKQAGEDAEKLVVYQDQLARNLGYNMSGGFSGTRVEIRVPPFYLVSTSEDKLRFILYYNYISPDSANTVAVRYWSALARGYTPIPLRDDWVSIAITPDNVKVLIDATKEAAESVGHWKKTLNFKPEESWGHEIYAVRQQLTKFAKDVLLKRLEPLSADSPKESSHQQGGSPAVQHAFVIDATQPASYQPTSAGVPDARSITSGKAPSSTTV